MRCRRVKLWIGSIGGEGYRRKNSGLLRRKGVGLSLIGSTGCNQMNGNGFGGMLQSRGRIVFGLTSRSVDGRQRSVHWNGCSESLGSAP